MGARKVRKGRCEGNNLLRIGVLIHKRNRKILKVKSNKLGHYQVTQKRTREVCLQVDKDLRKRKG